LPVPIVCTVRYGAPVAPAAGESRETFLERARGAVVMLADPQQIPGATP
jgi:hypothetical protein